MSSHRVPFRTAVVAVVICSFSIAALAGVAVLITGRDLSDTEVNVLYTTLVVGVASISLLCNLSTAQTRWAAVGALGGLATTVATVTSLLLIWAHFYDEEVYWQTWGIAITVAMSLAQVCLLLVVTREAAPHVQKLLVATLVAVAWVCGHICLLIVAPDLGDGSWRVLGIAAILDVLGTVVVAALARSGSRRPAPAALTVPDDVAARLTAWAQREGCSPEDALRQAVAALPERAER